MSRLRCDPFAAAAALLALFMLVAYLVLIEQEGDDPVGWVVVILVVGAAAAGYGALTRTAYRQWWLIGASVSLLGLGFLAMFTIGLPIMVAGALCIVAAVRAGTAPTA